MLSKKEKQKLRSKLFNDNIMSTKEGHIKRIISTRKHYATKSGLPFTVSLEHLISISPDICPIFGKPLLWATRNKSSNPFSPSLDKIIPELGYVEGNVQWLSFKANQMKNNATNQELKQFAEWVLKQSIC